MKFRYAGVLLAVCAVVLTSGCMTSERYAAYRKEADDRTFFQNYADTWLDWYADLTDLAGIELAAGEGIGLNVQATKLGNMGFLFCDVMKLGYRARGLGFYRETRLEGGLTWFYYRDMELDPIVGTPALFERERLVQDFTLRHNSDRHWADIGVEGYLIFGGGSIYVSPKETFDFLGNTLMLPYNIFLRTPLKSIGVALPEFDLSDDDMSSDIRRRHDVDLIRSNERFEPGEVIDQLMRMGY